MMAGNPGLDNGEWMMRAQREAQQQAINNYNAALRYAALAYQPYAGQASVTPGSTPNSPTSPGERPEPEDTTGLKMLEEFLARRKRNQGE